MRMKGSFVGFVIWALPALRVKGVLTITWEKSGEGKKSFERYQRWVHNISTVFHSFKLYR